MWCCYVTVDFKMHGMRRKTGKLNKYAYNDLVPQRLYNKDEVIKI